ncbi:MAG: hypothetical protein KatS3mg086_163 [Candidatus Dojkabacteria bacterium]|nr:MAG: hypothetical protein KatS3mg086_163 [Candidatus Dojkabacteria bacterium]
MKKKFKILLFLIVFFVIPPLVSAQNDSNSLEFNTGEVGEGLDPITISFFPQVTLIDAEYASFLSWLSFIANIAILALVLFWLYKIFFAGIEAMRGGGESEKLIESWKKVRAVIFGATISFLIPIMLSIVGAFLGVGAIWEWPLAFRECKDDRYDYYFQALQEWSQNTTISDPKTEVDNICF